MKKDKTIRFLGIPLYKRREKGGVRKKYFLGICYNKKKYLINPSEGALGRFPCIFSYPKTLKMLKIAIAEESKIGRASCRERV